MALSNYAELKSSIANWLHNEALTNEIPDFIALIEAKMSEDLDAKAMQTTTTLSTVAGNAYVNLPTDFKTMNRLVLTSDPLKLLKYLAPEQLTYDYPYAETQQPQTFTIIGAQIQLAPVPDAIYSLSLTYERRIPALSDSNTTNWLLTRSPNAYLFGALLMAQPYIVNDARIPTFQAMYQDAINGVNLTDWHSGTNMRVVSK